MSGSGGGMGLVEFLADLRADLEAAQGQAPEPGRAGEVLRLGVEEVTVTLEVTHVATQSGEVAAKAKAKFWVFAEAEAGVTGTLGRERSGSQTLTLTLRPRRETTALDQHGRPVTTSTGLDVKDQVSEEEEQAPEPSP